MAETNEHEEDKWPEATTFPAAEQIRSMRSPLTEVLNREAGVRLVYHEYNFTANVALYQQTSLTAYQPFKYHKKYGE